MEDRPPEHESPAPGEPPQAPGGDPLVPPQPPDEESLGPPQPPRGDSPEALLRRLRSRLPVSPLPWHWHKRINRATVIGIAVLVVGGAVASVLIQRGSESDSESAPALETSQPVKRKLAKLSLGEKASAVVLAGLGGGGAKELGEPEPGGVLVGPEDWAAGGARLVSALRKAGGKKRPLIVGRQEGGIYRSYPDLPPDLRQLEIGDTLDPALARSSARETAAALKRAGFDLNLGPVADVATLDSPIADRAFSDDPEVATAMTDAAVRGCAQGGIACAVKHFPGLGGASSDTADGPATVSLDASSLEARDLAPFRAAFQAGAPAVVLSLAFYAAHDPVTPGALSPTVATELLRGELGFKGVAISDDLTSGAITAGVGAPEAAVQALAAGSDMVLIDDPAQAKAAREAILQSAKSGGLSSARLDEAVARVLELKRGLGLLPR